MSQIAVTNASCAKKADGSYEVTVSGSSPSNATVELLKEGTVIDTKIGTPNGWTVTLVGPAASPPPYTYRAGINGKPTITGAVICPP